MRVDDVLQRARECVLPGLTPFDEIVEHLVELAADDYAGDGDVPATVEAVSALVRQVWDQRLSEQDDWPSTTDADRLAAAFAALEVDGIVARMNFTCCPTCGYDEIRNEKVSEGPTRGFVFFHSQEADGLVDEPATLALDYGAFGAADQASYETASLRIGHRIVAAVQAAGLTPEWDGTLDKNVAVTGLLWRRRLRPLPAP